MKTPEAHPSVTLRHGDGWPHHSAATQALFPLLCTIHRYVLRSLKQEWSAGRAPGSAANLKAQQQV